MTRATISVPVKTAAPVSSGRTWASAVKFVASTPSNSAQSASLSASATAAAFPAVASGVPLAWGDVVAPPLVAPVASVTLSTTTVGAVADAGGGDRRIIGPSAPSAAGGISAALPSQLPPPSGRPATIPPVADVHGAATMGGALDARSSLKAMPGSASLSSATAPANALGTLGDTWSTNIGTVGGTDVLPSRGVANASGSAGSGIVDAPVTLPAVAPQASSAVVTAAKAAPTSWSGLFKSSAAVATETTSGTAGGANQKVGGAGGGNGKNQQQRNNGASAGATGSPSTTAGATTTGSSRPLTVIRQSPPASTSRAGGEVLGGASVVGKAQPAGLNSNAAHPHRGTVRSHGNNVRPDNETAAAVAAVTASSAQLSAAAAEFFGGFTSFPSELQALGLGTGSSTSGTGVGDVVLSGGGVSVTGSPPAVAAGLGSGAAGPSTSSSSSIGEMFAAIQLQIAAAAAATVPPASLIPNVGATGISLTGDSSSPSPGRKAPLRFRATAPVFVPPTSPTAAIALGAAVGVSADTTDSFPTGFAVGSVAPSAVPVPTSS